MNDHNNKKKPPIEAEGDCTVCNGWIDDGRGGTCVFAVDYWTPCCPYEKVAKR